MDNFRAAVALVDAACCAGNQEDSCTSVCSPQCGAKLFRLESTCNATMTTLFDGMDGRIDGTARRVEALRSLCLAMPPEDALAELSRLEGEGCQVDTDGVAQTRWESSGTTCGDAGGRICDLIGAGLTCDRDFCSTCGHAGECDLTCGYCQSTGRKRGCNDLLSACPTLVESFGCDSSLEPLAHGTGTDVWRMSLWWRRNEPPEIGSQ